jgi:hypothetical protein
MRVFDHLSAEGWELTGHRVGAGAKPEIWSYRRKAK